MIAADEDIVRDLMHRYTEQVHPSPAIVTQVVARQRRRDRRRVMAAAGTAAAVAAAAGVFAVVPGHPSPATGGARSGIRLTADQRVLYGLSSAAATQPRAQGRYAVMTTEGTDVKDTSVIDSRTGDMWSYQAGSGGTPSGRGYTGHYSPTAAQFAAMPTSPAALRAALVTLWEKETSAASKPVSRTGGPTVTPRPVVDSHDDMVFQEASDMLWNPLVGPALRSALYKALAAVPGVKVNASATDGVGRPAVAISRVDSSGLPGGKSDGVAYTTYESPATGAVLESTVSYPRGSAVVTPQDPTGKDGVVDTTVYQSVTWATSVPGNPYRG